MVRVSGVDAVVAAGAVVAVPVATVEGSAAVRAGMEVNYRGVVDRAARAVVASMEGGAVGAKAETEAALLVTVAVAAAAGAAAAALGWVAGVVAGVVVDMAVSSEAAKEGVALQAEWRGVAAAMV